MMFLSALEKAQNKFKITDALASDYKSFREEILGLSAKEDVFYGSGPSGEKFYGAATQEMLDRVHLHYDSMRQ
jgi:hypothetical protein